MASEKVALKRVFYKKADQAKPPMCAQMKATGPNRATVEWWMDSHTGDEQEFMFVDVLLCPEMGLAYVLDYYGFRATDFTEEADEIYHSNLPKTRFCRENFDGIQEALRHWTGLKMVFYNKGHYKATCKKMGGHLLTQAATFYHALPKNCWVQIAQKAAPDWMKLALRKRTWRGKVAFFQDSIQGLLNDRNYDLLFAQLRQWAYGKPTGPSGVLLGEIYTRDWYLL